MEPGRPRKSGLS